jgi:hypothetical protein
MPSLPRSHRIVGRWCPSAGATGFRLIDRVRSNHGTLTNMDPASDWVASGGKLALDFDGSNDYLDLQTGGRQYPNLTQATWNFWVNFANFSKTYNQIAETFGTDGATTNYQLSCLVKSNGKLAFYIFGTSAGDQSNYDGTGSFTLSANTWYMLTYVFRGGIRQEGYVNGQLDGSAASPVSTMTASAQNVRLGFSSFADRHPAMRLDDSNLFNTDLTVNEIREIYRLGRGYGVFPEPDFDEGFAAAAGFKAYWARRQSQLIGGGV